jgi:hypothetical protein
MSSERIESGDWLARLERYDVEFVVLTGQTDGDLVTRLRCDPGWVARHEIEGAIFFQRRPPPEGGGHRPTYGGSAPQRGRDPRHGKKRGAGGCLHPPAPPDFGR